MFVSFDMTAFSPLLWEKCFAATSQPGIKIEENFLKVRQVCQSIFNAELNHSTYIFCWVLSMQSMSKVKFTWMIPDLVTSVLAGGTCPVSRGGDRGMEELFLTVTMTRSWPAPPVWPPPTPASLSSGLESPENWKEKIFALKSFYRNYANIKREGTISLKF